MARHARSGTRDQALRTSKWEATFKTVGDYKNSYAVLTLDFTGPSRALGSLQFFLEPSLVYVVVNFSFQLIFVFRCLKFISKHYHTQKQWKNKKNN